ncbi:MAG: hypothetical protein H6Q76_1335 [Firmicutes bacterium]|nr:hypothetical protein [Bacillota bacterium]
MFVVHTVNQLEEAIREGAEEILVTGSLATNVHEAYLSKSYKGQDETAINAPGGVSRRGGAKLLIITDEYSLLESQLDPQSPSMILQRASQH